MAAARANLLIEAAIYKATHRREFPPEWYAWQLEGFACLLAQWLTMAANRTGKTLSEGYHFACDATGLYPDWWDGFRFDYGGINMLAMGVDNEQLKEVVQHELFGDLGPNRQFNGGWIHPSEISTIEWSQTTGLARRVFVHSTRGISRITLRAYTQSKTGHGTLSFAGTSFDRVWIDECPPDHLVGQLITRTMTGNLGRGGHIGYTMTPELGVTNLVHQFMEERAESQLLVGPVPWSECPHLTPEVQATILSGLPEHEKDMRSKGTPFFGSGLIFPITDSRIKVEPFNISIEKPWVRVLRAIDLGVTPHPTALVWLAYDPEEDTIYLTSDYSVVGEAAAIHAAAANKKWAFAPLVFPHDVDITEKGTGKTVRYYYETAGITNGIDFKNPDGSLSVEAGILDLNQRMRDGRFKVFSDCFNFFREKGLYHRMEGKIVKKNDDVIDATRYGSAMIIKHGVSISGIIHKPKVKKAMAGKMSNRRRGSGRR